MPSPLQWRSKRQWSFMVSLRQPTLFLIRDHINMFTDLGKDWSTGPPIDFQLWIPMVYVVNLELRNYELNLYANDLNIIDKPLVKDDNGRVRLLCLIPSFSSTFFSAGHIARANYPGPSQHADGRIQSHRHNAPLPCRTASLYCQPFLASLEYALGERRPTPDCSREGWGSSDRWVVYLFCGCSARKPGAA